MKLPGHQDSFDIELDRLLAEHVERTSSSSGAPNTVREQTISAMLAKQNEMNAEPARRFFTLAITSLPAKIAVAAVLLIGIGAAVFTILGKPAPAMAFSELQQNVHGIKTMTATWTDLTTGEPETKRVTVSGKWSRIDGPRFAIAVNDTEQISWALDKKSMLALKGLDSEMGLNPVAVVLDLGLAATRRGEPALLNGRPVWLFEGQHRVRSEGATHALKVSVWVDRTTRLPVQLQVFREPGLADDLLLTDMKFDVAVNDDLFVIPKQARVIDAAAPVTIEQLDKSLHNQTAQFTITPGKSVGPVMLDSVDTTAAKSLGLPERADSNQRRYLSQGIILLVDPIFDSRQIECVAPGIIQGDVTLGFAGTTDRGVRIGSTLAEVEAAYGPGKREPGDLPGNSRLQYAQLGIRFELQSDRVTSIRIYRIH